jgi:16S rRNA (cytosine1402-N4)-methyltransferase
MYPGRNPGAALAEGLRMSPRHQPEAGPEPDPGVKAASEPGPDVSAAPGPDAAAPGPDVSAAPGPDAATASGEFDHQPVMLAEVVDLFAPVPSGVMLDATVGAGGHARALLEASSELRLVGLDRDPDAVAAARSALAPFGSRATVVQGRFDHLSGILEELGIPSLVGALFDLGVSSPQLDRADRGFSYRADAPLDMRMDPSSGITAAELISRSTEDQLARLFALHGEERFARRIASAIVAARPVTTTSALAELVSNSVPAAVRRRGHPAKRVFQALRAAVNGELEVLPPAIDDAIARLSPGGRIVVISYHSGEDRLVKQRLVEAATGGCTCPPGLPCVCGAQPRVRLLNRGSRPPSPAEQVANRRARSARLRAAEALPLPSTLTEKPSTLMQKRRPR